MSISIGRLKAKRNMGGHSTLPPSMILEWINHTGKNSSVRHFFMFFPSKPAALDQGRRKLDSRYLELVEESHKASTGNVLSLEDSGF